CLMQVHENHYIKRAGVAGGRAFSYINIPAPAAMQGLGSRLLVKKKNYSCKEKRGLLPSTILLAADGI
ncbi:hypothetical protein BUJ08_24120, partial [Salmonella enterica subsp. enterica serovar Javiana]